MHHQIKHIVWDWNGTLVNDAWLFVELMNEELKQRNLSLIDIAKYKEHFTFPVKQYYKNLGFDFKKENFKEVGYNFIQKYKKRKHEPLLFEQAKEKRPDLILLDVNMPGWDGFDTFKKLQEDQFTKNIPVIFLTADTDLKRGVEGLEM